MKICVFLSNISLTPMRCTSQGGHNIVLNMLYRLFDYQIKRLFPNKCKTQQTNYKKQFCEFSRAINYVTAYGKEVVTVYKNAIQRSNA